MPITQCPQARCATSEAIRRHPGRCSFLAITSVPFLRQFLALLVTVVIAGCATPGRDDVAPSATLSTLPQAPLSEVPVPPPVQVPRPLPMPPPAPAPAPAPSERAGRVVVNHLLPANIGDRSAWAADILAALVNLRIPALPENVCAAIAIIEQESGFQADPPVPGLSRIVWQEIEKRREKYGIPKIVLDIALLKSSPDGRTYKARIDALRSENQMNVLFDDMISELPGGKTLLAGYNPVRTGGPMQASVNFAEEQTRSQTYPYARRDSVRKEVFSRRGGVYFGIAMLLDYPAHYSRMIYRFADFNAGRYSSRNAAFQEAVSRLSGRTLSLDGDLLRYRDGVAVPEASDTQRAILVLRAGLNLSAAEILRDLKLEKSPTFEQTPLYLRLYALADAAAGEKCPRERLPQIDLKSPKITRQLTTEWFARRVDGRYRDCLARNKVEAYKQES